MHFYERGSTGSVILRPACCPPWQKGVTYTAGRFDRAPVDAGSSGESEGGAPGLSIGTSFGNLGSDKDKPL